jgi:stage II sporulation protein E
MLDYRGLSEMLEDFSALDEEFEINAEQTRTLRSALCREFPEIESLICYGKGQRKVMLFTSSGNELQALSHIIASRLFELTSIQFEADEDGEEETYLLFRQKAKISALHAYISLRADGEDTFCGDTVSSFEADENISFTLVSDGMGSGKDASLASQICNMFLQKTLSAGTSPLIALRQLNLFLRSRAKDAARETCATIDLLSIDAISSRAIFYKVGAAPSFIFRKSNIYKVESKTLPLGIIRELDAKKTSFELEAGDMIVMISDGALRSGGDCPFLFDIMKKCAATHSPEDLSAMIAKRAKKENGNDDISVAVIKISEN